MNLSDLNSTRWVAYGLRVLQLCFILMMAIPLRIEAGTNAFSIASDQSNERSAAIPASDAGDLTLRDAINLALTLNPELAAFAKEMKALEGATLQAGLLRNPELTANVENPGNIQKLSGDVNSPDAVAQEVVQQLTTIRIGQLIELGGKRAARVDAALLGEELAARDYESRRVEIMA